MYCEILLVMLINPSCQCNIDCVVSYALNFFFVGRWVGGVGWKGFKIKRRDTLKFLV